MTVSVFDLFAVGIGPSILHTVGPMKAACNFAAGLAAHDLLRAVTTVSVDLYGSLAATALGHGTLPAILLGLEGYWPESINAHEKDRRTAELREDQRILLDGRQDIALGEHDISLHPSTVLDFHSNGLTFSAASAGGQELYRQTYFSVGAALWSPSRRSNRPGRRRAAIFRSSPQTNFSISLRDLASPLQK